jgi:hypothetical protein
MTTTRDDFAAWHKERYGWYSDSAMDRDIISDRFEAWQAALLSAHSVPDQKDLTDTQKTILGEQESLNHPATQVFFRAGLLACREYMARFVEHESPTIAASIRANWWPTLGQDFGAPRKLEWIELTEGEYGEEGFRAKTANEISPTQEALPIALKFLLSLDPGNARGRCTLGLEGLERSLYEGVQKEQQR